MATIIKISHSEHNESPREWDNLGTFAMAHGRYNIGDTNFHSTSDLEDHIPKNAIRLDVFMYDHSGISLSTTPFACRWDSGQVGVIFVDRDKVRKEYNWTKITKARKEKIEQYLKNEIETLNQFVSGEVYGFDVEVDGVSEDSCGGFYGRDIETNGMKEYLGEYLENATIEYV